MMISTDPPIFSAEPVDDVFVVIAAYQEASKIGEVVSSLRRHYSNVVVVDDGSTDATGEIAGAAGALVLKHMVNRGQGAAVQTGITYSLSKGAAYIVTFDADGQHRPEDIAMLVLPLVKGEADVTLGSRFLGRSSVPVGRRLLLRAGIVFTWMVSGARLTDAHNGLRGFSRKAAQAIEIRLDRMAHASEIIDLIVRAKLRIREVPVVVRYTAYSRRKGQSSLGAVRVMWDYLIGRWIR